MNAVIDVEQEVATEPLPAVGTGKRCSVEGCGKVAYDCCWMPGCGKLLCIQHARVRHVLSEEKLLCPAHAQSVDLARQQKGEQNAG